MNKLVMNGKHRTVSVTVGSAIIINGLEFEPGISTLTSKQKLIVQDVFNCLEEITENTLNDTYGARVAEHKKFEFETCVSNHPGLQSHSQPECF